jgi:hypothetical protein
MQNKIPDRCQRKVVKQNEVEMSECKKSRILIPCIGRRHKLDEIFYVEYWTNVAAVKMIFVNSCEYYDAKSIATPSCRSIEGEDKWYGLPQMNNPLCVSLFKKGVWFAKACMVRKSFCLHCVT